MSRSDAGQWEFWIDVGGTFTDCIARRPDGDLRTFKTLSSGETRCAIATKESPTVFSVTSCPGNCDSFWVGYEFHCLLPDGRVEQAEVIEFTHATRQFTLNRSITAPAGTSFSLRSAEAAPLFAIRALLGLRLQDPIPPVRLRLGTTRGTNALLTRTGAQTAFVTTRGFGDILRIGNQDRPDLFALDIVKPQPLFQAVIEIEERVDAAGQVVQAPETATVRAQLEALREENIESLAICLMHAYRNPRHEQIVAAVAAECGFTEISVSSQVSPLIKIVSRGDTTVLDAYLNPVLREYLRGIVSRLPGSRVELMTSVGGLVNVEHFSGRDSLLSGPAGGVVGFAQAATAAGFRQAIGFDMGGTSTDVSRYAGEWTLDFETVKGGVRIAAPALSIETVAAGGGSICEFDGVRLKVGPGSAGASPGPACYGKGGPLTVTDLNVCLGRILPEEFPFPLDLAALNTKLNELRERVNAAHGTGYSTTELAEGLLQIANANMVRAIRRVSVARGFHPADHVLVSFGGAGAQHACAVADALGIQQVLIHPFAGILSAWGIGQATPRSRRARSVLAPLTGAQLAEIFAPLQAAAVDELTKQGAASESIRVTRSLDLRYTGLEASVNVLEPDDGDFAAAYEQQHHREFGYAHADRDIEIVAARVEAAVDPPRTDTVDSFEKLTEARPARSAEMVVDGAAVEAGVFHREHLPAGSFVPGPAILVEENSTIVVEPDWSAVISARGALLLERTSGASTSSTSVRETAIDPIQLEVMNNRFAAIAEQMGETLRKTSVSTNVKERLDFSCAVFDSTGSLVVNAPHIPVHLGAMSETVRCVIRDNPDIAPGDVFVTNDPFRGGSHLPDVTVVTPVHARESGELMFFTASRAHHAEIGGILPGSMPPFSTCLAEEGFLIRNFRLVARGDSRESELRELLQTSPLPSRAVADNISDIRAQVAANRIGATELLGLVTANGRDSVQLAMDRIQQAAAEKLRFALSGLDDGIYTHTDYLDDGSPITATITIRADSVKVDFTGTGPVLRSNLNANRAIVSAAVMYVMRCLIAEDIPLNGGVLDPVEIVLPECLLHPPEHDDPARCAAMVGGNVETSQRVVDVLLGALGLAAASQGTMNNLTFGNADFGYYETICGGAGATASAPGADAVHTHMTNTRLTDPEIIEHRYPVRLDEFRIREASGGQGAMRGGNGIVRRLTFLEPLTVSMLSQRRGRYAPFGLSGGGAGETGRNELITREGTIEHAGGAFSRAVEAGTSLIIMTPGGGAYGEA